jgi:hypothetical protein
MRTIQQTVFSFDELTNEAKENARNEVRNIIDPFPFMDEAYNTVKEFFSVFGVTWRNISFEESYYNSYSVNFSDDVLSLTGHRLAKYIWNNYKIHLFRGKYYGKLAHTYKDGSPIEKSKEHPAGTRHVKRYSRVFLSTGCVLTGVCYDYDILNPIYEFLNKPDGRYINDLIEECISSISESVKSEIRFRLSDEGIYEEIESNGYEFYEDGSLFL